MGSGAKSSELLYQSVSNISSQSSGFSHIHENLHPECDDLVECGNLDAFGYDMCVEYSDFLDSFLLSKLF
mgnify:CR=1 FL=1